MEKYLMEINEARIATLKKRLESHGFEVTVFENGQQCTEYVLNIIKPTESIGSGGSLTLEKIGLKDALEEKGYNFLNTSKCKTAEEKKKMYHDHFNCDYYLMSSNAISMEGHLYNIDGRNNRVAALSYGPEHVLVIVGVNKIFADENGAIDHCINVAAPANCLRLNTDVPCVKVGFCCDCNSPDRRCATYVKTVKTDNKRIHVMIIKEDLGL